MDPIQPLNDGYVDRRGPAQSISTFRSREPVWMQKSIFEARVTARMGAS